MNRISKLLLGTILLLSFTMLACKKQLIEKYKENPSSIRKTSEIKAADNFNWETNHTLGVSFVPNPDDVRMGTFRVVAPDGSNLFQKYQKASEALNFNLEIPNEYDSLIVSFGNYSKYYSTKSGVVELRLN